MTTEQPTKNSIGVVLRHYLKVLGIVPASAVAGLILLMFVYLLPSSIPASHVRDNVSAMLEEGNYPGFLENNFVRMHPYNISPDTMLRNNRGMARDNFTDGLILGAAAYDDDTSSILEKALLAYHYESVPDEPVNSLYAYVVDGIEDGRESYARYWHGYLVIWKPLLEVLTYYQIRMLNVLIQLALIIYILWALNKQLGIRSAAIFLASLCMTFPIVIPFCLQFSAMFYLMLISAALTLRFARLSEDGRYAYFFLGIGIATAYFDFLTYPLLPIGVALTFVLALREQRGDQTDRGVRVVTRGLIHWGIGYAGMWAMKWILASVLTKENVIADALEQIAFRTHGTTESGGLSPSAMTAIAANFSCYTNILFIVLGVLYLILLIIFAVQIRRHGQKQKMAWEYLILAALPFVWYSLAASHSYDHSSYTYRNLMVSFWAFAMMVLSNGRFNSNHTDKE